MAKLEWQIPGGEDIHSNPKHLFQFDLNGTQIQQRCARQRVNQQIQVASFFIHTVQHGTEYSGIARAISCNHTTDVFAVRTQGFRRFHG